MFVERVHLCEENSVLLIVDSHSSHKNLEVILFAQELYVHILSRPTHRTHRLQSLNRVVIKSFANVYNESCLMWMKKYPKIKIGFKDIAGLVNSAFLKNVKIELV